MTWALLAVVVVTTVLSDTLQSRGMKRHGEIHDFRPAALNGVFRRVARNPEIALSVFFMAVSFFAFLKLLSVADLSFAVPATAASYVIQAVVSKYVLKEAVGRRRWAGVLLVASGVALLAM
jgi:drug/metabolite transporter (DMT)-like permease